MEIGWRCDDVAILQASQLSHPLPGECGQQYWNLGAKSRARLASPRADGIELLSWNRHWFAIRSCAAFFDAWREDGGSSQQENGLDLLQSGWIHLFPRAGGIDPHRFDSTLARIFLRIHLGIGLGP